MERRKKGWEKKSVLKKWGANLNFFAKSSDHLHAYISELLLILLVYKEAYFNSDNLDSCVPNVVKVILQEFEDVFIKEIPSGLLSISGIECQIDFVPRASIPNRPTYMSNPEESKELQQQVKELMSKGYIRESMSPSSILMVLIPNKNKTW